MQCLLSQAYQPDKVIAQRIRDDVLISHCEHKEGEEGNQKKDDGVIAFEFEAHGLSPNQNLFFYYIPILGFHPVKTQRKSCEITENKKASR